MRDCWCCAGGCGDNTFYGVKFVLEFLQARENERNYPRFSRPLARSQLNLWNSFTGLVLLRNNWQVGCKCHGVSGSCSMTTCWEQLPPFRTLGAKLRSKFERAVKVRFNANGDQLVVAAEDETERFVRLSGAMGRAAGSMRSGGAGAGAPRGRARSSDSNAGSVTAGSVCMSGSPARAQIRPGDPPPVGALIFVEQLVDFCRVDVHTANRSVQTGFDAELSGGGDYDAGDQQLQMDEPNARSPAPALPPSPVSGRECVRNATGPGSCDALCCGRGATTVRTIVTVQCRCRFQWCCSISCKQCHETRNFTSCN